MEAKRDRAAFHLNILIKEERDLCVAHCLELDIVATANTIDQAQEDLLDLIVAQINYAFSNDNLDFLYHPAPPKVWEEFFQCEEGWLKERKVKLPAKNQVALEPFVPPWIIAQTCKASQSRHV